jgi:CelD/BcsL family acetyltransferase involved in cellulose biosynthesis
VEVVESAEGLARLESEWNALLEDCPGATAFSTFEWAWTCLTYRPGPHRPLVLRVREGETTVGLVPLRRRGGRMRPRVLEPLALGYAWLADYVDVLARAGCERAVLERAIEALRARGGFEILEWPELREGGITRELLPLAAHRAGLPFLVDPGTPCHRIPLPATWPEYLARLSPDLRETLERKTRKVVREEGARFIRVTEEQGIGPALDALHRFQEARWGARGSASLTAYVGFLRELLPRLLRRGWLDLRVLQGTAPLAVMVNFRLGKDTAYYAMGFDPDRRLSRYSPGTILLGDGIRAAIEEGSSVLDMMRGEEAWKARFDSRVTRNQRVRIFRRRPLFLVYAWLQRRRRPPALIANAESA